MSIANRYMICANERNKSKRKEKEMRGKRKVLLCAM